MKTTLLDRENSPEKAFQVLLMNEHYSSKLGTLSKCQTVLDNLGLEKLELSLFLQALTHSSFENENELWPFSDNERLEFIGDSVLELFISEQLVMRFPDMSEGNMSKFRSALVNETFLAGWSRILDLEPLVLLGKGERQGGVKVQNSILANIFEALVGSIHLCCGFSESQAVLLSWINIWEEKQSEDFFSPKRLEEFDPKSRLQELALAQIGELPQYLSREREDGTFEVCLTIAGQELAKIIHQSKRKAEKILAQNALKSTDFLAGEKKC